ncbi:MULTISPECIES: DUF6264 family protein [Curtobacterium]|uniref:DUF6264 family protein n=1 Tax=Curtobacterium poinsettiae TaxID=159612 RepID=A0ABT3S1X4_9MICO|nr:MULTISPECIES: DUF6264 family protein [Curtobacterium]KIQ07845.1 hypothetical protein RU06_10495 [Curtobacterium flaccumfaciens]MBT1609213.1 hypothetical protein [Curtobacterium flaccumfaciens pv. poinsettiae]MCX2848833.1 DUF6264 family protein [Curtobacterium flaccumfaciens pv. poinsettiae]UXN19757.1 DUF6264 family protein [Curtobacterium flaccumfaciens pv. poinsettiae]UXZ58591.1 DUF6264 family protein [Curtobacterium sp. Arg-1]
MSGADGWSSVPRRHPADHGDAGVGSGQEARGTSPTSPAGPANGRPQGRPAPGYGEYAPEGWVNPVLVEQERQERQDRERQDQAKAVGGRDAAPRDSVRTDHARPDARSGAAPAGVQRTMPRSRFGRTPADFVLTVGLLAFGLVSVVQSLSVGDVASTVRRTLETQYTALNDPSALSTAAVIAAITNVVVFALVAWWSIRRLRARKRTFWVPLVGAVVATAISTIAFVVVVLQDQAFVDFMLRQSGA